MLEASGISNDVIEQRGYRSIQDKAELKKLGFATPQSVYKKHHGSILLSMRPIMAICMKASAERGDCS